jgi:hypothetical protein
MVKYGRLYTSVTKDESAILLIFENTIYLMKSLTKIIYTASLALFAAAIAISCGKNVTVACPSGYEGTNCNTQSRDKFIGTWTQASTNPAIINPTQFAVSVLSGSSITNLQVSNFNNTFTQPVSGNITAHDSLIFPVQDLEGKTVQGFCFYVGNSTHMIVHYTITNDATGTIETVDTNW